MHGPLPERVKDRESRVIEYGRFLSDTELPAIPDSKPPREMRESCRKYLSDTELLAIPDSKPSREMRESCRKSSPDTELPAISGL